MTVSEMPLCLLLSIRNYYGQYDSVNIALTADYQVCARARKKDDSKSRDGKREHLTTNHEDPAEKSLGFALLG